MKKFEFKSLVRDKIPAMIKSASKNHVIKIKKLTENDYYLSLLQKLNEESAEVKELVESAKKSGRKVKASQLLIEELADVQEVLDTLVNKLGLSRKKVSNAQKKKRAKAGSFKKKKFLEWVEVEDSYEHIGRYKEKGYKEITG